MTRYILSFALLVGPITLGSAGCSGNDNVTEDEASEGWQVAAKPLRKGQQKILEKVESTDRQKLLGGDPVTARVDCNDEGETAFRLAVDVGRTGELEIDFTANYDECMGTQVIVNGTLDIGSPNNFGFSGTPTGGGAPDASTGGTGGSSGSQSTTLTYTGNLHYSGDVDGPCNVDLTVETSNGQPTYSGSLCGYDAADVLGFSF